MLEKRGRLPQFENLEITTSDEGEAENVELTEEHPWLAKLREERAERVKAAIQDFQERARSLEFKFPKPGRRMMSDEDKRLFETMSSNMAELIMAKMRDDQRRYMLSPEGSQLTERMEGTYGGPVTVAEGHRIDERKDLTRDLLSRSIDGKRIKKVQLNISTWSPQQRLAAKGFYQDRLVALDENEDPIMFAKSPADIHARTDEYTREETGIIQQEGDHFKAIEQALEKYLQLAVNEELPDTVFAIVGKKPSKDLSTKAFRKLIELTRKRTESNPQSLSEAA